MKKLSQNISSNSLFHFITKREWLLEILKNKAFQARYVYEDLPELNYKVGIPMKCFCDIPLGLIKKHLNRYGNFGMGITKSFAKKHHLSPIIYIHEKSDTFTRYISTIKKNDIFKNQYSLIPYFKVDIRTRKGSDGKKTFERYYDEREWRFIPPKAEFLDFTDFDIEEIRNSRLDLENNRLATGEKEYLLQFDYSDITYIFVQFEKDVDKVIEAIRRMKISMLQQDS
jgi:hypothetical protein